MPKPMPTEDFIIQLATRVWEYLKAKIAFAFAAFNILARWRMKVDENGLVHLSIADFCL